MPYPRDRIAPARSTSTSSSRITAITQDTTFSGSTSAMNSPTGTELLPSLLLYNEVDEDAACEDVRRMAEALAPQVAQLEDAIRENTSSFDEFVREEDRDDDSLHDDNLDDEMQQLALSEQSLREELEMAQEFSNWMVSPRPSQQSNRFLFDDDSHENDKNAAVPTRRRSASSMSMEENFSSDDEDKKDDEGKIESKEDEPLSYENFARQVPTNANSSSEINIEPGAAMASFETPGSTAELLSSSAISLPSLELEPPSFLKETSIDSALGNDTSAENSGGNAANDTSILSSSTVSSEAQSPAPSTITRQQRRRRRTTNSHTGISVSTTAPTTPRAYTLEDHAKHLKLCTEKVGGWYYSDATQFLYNDDDLHDDDDEGDDCYSNYDGREDQSKYDDQSAHQSASSFIGSPPPPPPKSNPFARQLIKDYCLPIPIRKLKRLYTGLVNHEVSHQPSHRPPLPSASSTDDLVTIRQSSTVSNDPAVANATRSIQDEPLPVRTLSIRIRPDVLCGAVMDAVHHAMEVDTAHVLKRQGGHLRGAVVNGNYVIDAQLCTHKQHTDSLERRLLLRFYHLRDDPDAYQEVGEPANDLNESAEQMPQDETSIRANRNLKQSCSLIQRLMAQHVGKRQAGKNGTPAPAANTWLGLSDMAFSSRESMQQAIGNHLESNYKTCPSVREENKKVAATISMRRLTLPSLSRKDWPVLQASWLLVSAIWEELDTRDLTYNTLATLPFGHFPCLPTLDVHFCSQLRRLSRDAMITQLLKSAKELEDYAKSAEYNCANLVLLLGPMVQYYRVPPIDLTKPKALEDYPLEYTPPQVSCPPWGSKVMKAMNQVAARTTTAAAHAMQAEEEDKSIDDGKSHGMNAGDAVRKVYAAFVKQDDEEQSARLGRKNAQVMERLSNMQSYQRAVIHSIRDAHVHSKIALQAADSFLINAQQASNIGQPGFPRAIRAQVPILNFRISVGGSISGTCYITAHQILFSTTYIPFVGGLKNMLFDLTSVSFRVDENVASTLLNPFPNTMFVILDESYNQQQQQRRSRNSNGEKVLFSFRPSIGPSRLHKFLKVIQTFQSEAASTPTEFSQPDDKVLVEEDGILRLANTVSEDQLSISI